MEKSNLNNLMKRIQEDRDEMAFSEIFDFFAPKVNAYFIQNRIKFESSEELTQEVLSTVWVKSTQYDSKKAALSTFGFVVVAVVDDPVDDVTLFVVPVALSLLMFSEEILLLLFPFEANSSLC